MQKNRDILDDDFLGSDKHHAGCDGDEDFDLYASSDEATLGSDDEDAIEMDDDEYEQYIAEEKKEREEQQRRQQQAVSREVSEELNTTLAVLKTVLQGGESGQNLNGDSAPTVELTARERQQAAAIRDELDAERAEQAEHLQKFRGVLDAEAKKSIESNGRRISDNFKQADDVDKMIRKIPRSPKSEIGDLSSLVETAIMEMSKPTPSLKNKSKGKKHQHLSNENTIATKIQEEEQVPTSAKYRPTEKISSIAESPDKKLAEQHDVGTDTQSSLSEESDYDEEMIFNMMLQAIDDLKDKPTRFDSEASSTSKILTSLQKVLPVEEQVPAISKVTADPVLAARASDPAIAGKENQAEANVSPPVPTLESLAQMQGIQETGGIDDWYVDFSDKPISDDQSHEETISLATLIKQDVVQLSTLEKKIQLRDLVRDQEYPFLQQMQVLSVVAHLVEKEESAGGKVASIAEHLQEKGFPRAYTPEKAKESVLELKDMMKNATREWWRQSWVSNRTASCFSEVRIWLSVVRDESLAAKVSPEPEAAAVKINI